MRGFNTTALNVRVNEQKSSGLQLINVPLQPSGSSAQVKLEASRSKDGNWSPEVQVFVLYQFFQWCTDSPQWLLRWFSRLPVEGKMCKCWTHDVWISSWLQPAGLSASALQQAANGLFSGWWRRAAAEMANINVPWVRLRVGSLKEPVRRAPARTPTGLVFLRLPWKRTDEKNQVGNKPACCTRAALKFFTVNLNQDALHTPLASFFWWL